MREQSSQEHETELSQLFTDAFVYAYAANRGGKSGAKKQPIVKKDNGLKLSKGNGLIGKDYEIFLTRNLPNGAGSFMMGGREFDGKYFLGGKETWFEAKSGRYWERLNTPKELGKFRSDMGDRLNIAKTNNVNYELFSNTPIPNEAKQFLDKKGIKYTETF